MFEQREPLVDKEWNNGIEIGRAAGRKQWG